MTAKPKTKKPSRRVSLDASKLNAPTLVQALGMLGHVVSETEVLGNPAPFVNGLARQVIAAKQFMRSVGDASVALQVVQAKASLFDRMFAVARREEPDLTEVELMAQLAKNLDEAEADQAALDMADTEPAPDEKCGCVFATAENTPSVRDGYEVGGYIKTPCPEHA